MNTPKTIQNQTRTRAFCGLPFTFYASRITYLFVTLIFSLLPSALFAQGTTFTYQGRLVDNAGLANGIYDLRFTIYDALSGGSTIGGPLTNAATTLNNGLFTVTLDFGSAPFSAGSPRWMEIQVRTNGSGSFGTLNPRQALTAAPYAITAGTLTGAVGPAGLSGPYANAVSFSNPSNQFTGNYTGNGLGLSNVTAVSLGGLTSANFWQLGGNATVPGQFLGSTNFQAVEVWVNRARGLRLEPTVNDASHSNIINVIGGSRANSVSNGVHGATIAGGGGENNSGLAFPNSVGADYGTVGGGSGNLAGGTAATVPGGLQNTATMPFSTVGGGRQNVATGGQFGEGAATVAGGSANNAIGDYSTVGGGQQNNATVYSSVVGGGFGNSATNAEAMVAGGFGNSAGGSASTVAGGDHNVAAQRWGTVAGGQGNLAGSTAATVGGGTGNTATGNLQGYATVPGGRDNTASGNYSFAAGYNAQALHDGAFVWADSIGSAFSSTGSNQFLIRAGGGVGIGTSAPEAPLHVAEGSAGNVAANANSVAVFERNGNSYVSLLVPAANETGFVFGNPNTNTDAAIMFNNASVPGGLEFRTGTNLNRMAITVNGNVGIGITAPTNKLHVIGGATFSSGVSGSDQAVVWTPGSAAWSFTSDRNTKERFAPVDPETVLEKVNRLPISEWSYKGFPQRHIGAMAQDFHAEFPLNESDTTLNDADLHGVALAAIQGLNRKLEQRETEISTLRDQNQALARDLEALQAAVAALQAVKAVQPR